MWVRSSNISACVGDSTREMDDETSGGGQLQHSNVCCIKFNR